MLIYYCRNISDRSPALSSSHDVFRRNVSLHKDTLPHGPAITAPVADLFSRCPRIHIVKRRLLVAAEMLQDPLDLLPVRDHRQDAHLLPAFRAKQRVHVMHLLDHACPGGSCLLLRDCLHGIVGSGVCRVVLPHAKPVFVRAAVLLGM